MSRPLTRKPKKSNLLSFGATEATLLWMPNPVWQSSKGHPNNMTDEKIARKLYKKLKRLYTPQTGMIVIGDKAYDVRDFYTFLVDQIKAEQREGGVENRWASRV